jgi:hypothetical protein
MIHAIQKRNGMTKRKLEKTTADILYAALRAQKLSSKVLYWVTQFHDLVHEVARQCDKQNAIISK